MRLISLANKKQIENQLNDYSNIKKDNFFLISDKLKEFGFYFSRVSGYSLGVNDLKSLVRKNYYFSNNDKNIKKLKIQWDFGKISRNDYFDMSSELCSSSFIFLKNTVSAVYELSSFFTTLNVMVLSGSRGNWSQNTQLTEFRGVMLDQEGKSIDVPVYNNFKDGLSLLDYSISYYSSRKGIIDTAQKTATSGYLTRRLVFLMQDAIVKTNDCLTLEQIGEVQKSSVTLLFLSIFSKTYTVFTKKGFRSLLTCTLVSGICQRCYGINNVNKELISLGSAIGIITAQSISEPTTQMTLKTFHTGGTSSDTSKNDNLSSLSSSRIIFNNQVFGSLLSKCFENSSLNSSKNQKLTIFSWKGKKHFLSLPSNFTFLPDDFFTKHKFFISSEKEKGVLISKLFEPFVSCFNGLINFKLALIQKQNYLKNFKDSVNNIVFEDSFILIDHYNVKSFLNNFFYLFLKNSFLKKMVFFQKKAKIKGVFSKKFFKSFLFFYKNRKKNKIHYHPYFDKYIVQKPLCLIFKDNFFTKSLKIKKNNNNFFIIASTLNNEKTNSIKLKLNSHSILNVNNGDILKKTETYGYSTFSNSRDEDIVNALDKIDLIFEGSKEINYVKMFLPLSISKIQNTKLNILPNNLITFIFDFKKLFNSIFFYQEKRHGNSKGLYITVKKFSIILSNSLSSIYYSQDTNVSIFHFDLIIRHLTSLIGIKTYNFKSSIFSEKESKTKILIFKPINFISLNKLEKKIYHNSLFNFTSNQNPQTYFMHNYFLSKKIEIFYDSRESIIKILNQLPLDFNKIKIIKKQVNDLLQFKPLFISERSIIALKSQFLLKIAFQNARKEFSNSSLYGKINWTGSLRENVIVSDLSSVGSAVSKLKESFKSNFFYKK